MFSCTTGPAGTNAGAGGTGRSLVTSRHTSARESASQSHGASAAPDSGGVAIGFAVALRTSATHSRSASASVTVNAIDLPSGDHRMSPIFAPSGMPRIWRGAASFAMRSSTSSRCTSDRRGGCPLIEIVVAARFFGLIRTRVSRTSGSATSAIDGNSFGVTSISVRRSGDTLGCGIGAASTKLATAFTGRW